MAENVFAICVLVSIVDANRYNIDVKAAQERTDITIPFSFSLLNKRPECMVFTPKNSNFGVHITGKFINFTDRLTLIRESENTLNIDIKNVSKDDEGLYNIRCYDFDSGVLEKTNFVFLQTIGNIPDESFFQYNATELVKEGSNYTLNVRRYIHIKYHVIRTVIILFNGTTYSAITDDLRFNLSYQNGNFVFTTDDLTTDDEGIYHMSYITLFPKHLFKKLPPIRFLIKKLQFTSSDNGNITSGSEGRIITLVCEIFGSFDVEEIFIETKGKKRASGKPPTIIYSFLAKRSDHLSQCTCKANILNYPTKIYTDNILIINHPPSVRVELSIDQKSLHCLAQGYPANYTFYWTRFSYEFQNVTGLSNGTLILPQKTNGLPKSVSYTCYVSNGIQDIQGQLYQTDKICVTEGKITDTDHSLIYITVTVATVFALYTIVSLIVCCYKKKKHQNRGHDMTQNHQCDEIGTISYHSIAIGPLNVREPIPSDHVSVDAELIREANIRIQNDNAVDESRQNPSGSTTVDHTGNGDVQLPAYDNHNYGSTNLGNRHVEEAERSFFPLTENEYEHAYTQTFPRRQNEHKYSDLIGDITSEERRDLNRRRNDQYINLRVWES